MVYAGASKLDQLGDTLRIGIRFRYPDYDTTITLQVDAVKRGKAWKVVALPEVNDFINAVASAKWQRLMRLSEAEMDTLRKTVREVGRVGYKQSRMVGGFETLGLVRLDITFVNTGTLPISDVGFRITNPYMSDNWTFGCTERGVVIQPNQSGIVHADDIFDKHNPLLELIAANNIKGLLVDPVAVTLHTPTGEKTVFAFYDWAQVPEQADSAISNPGRDYDACASP